VEIEITKMQLSDLEQIRDNLAQKFDNFWTTRTLQEELENKNRFRFSLYSSKTKSRNCRICRSVKDYR
jgi:uncharacterized protein YdeI (YjbR/CyaY-like superfamily)